MSRWDQEFFSTTRGHIVSLLRGTRQTVDELAASLGLTDNAVRAHLVRLERDGLVRQHGVRKGERRPAIFYELTPEAEQLFPKAYMPALRRLLEVLSARSSRGTLRQIVTEAGRRLARGQAPRAGDRRARLLAAARVLSEVGGLAHVEVNDDGRLELRSDACPLDELVVDHPELCVLAEGLVAEASGLPVQEHCDRSPGEPPRCRFTIVRG